MLTSGATGSVRRGSTDVVRTTFSGREIISALTSHGFVPVGGKGSHTTLRYENPDTDEVRVVTVPHDDTIPTGTLQAIAEQAGAEDFHEFCAWIDRSC
jgi:predicted RNA binding protein YcfA (HicA-like mRNA interferase family)